MTLKQIEKIAPNQNMWLVRPILADPPIYNLRDLNTWVTLYDVMDAHELLDLRQAMNEAAMPKGQPK